jgi:hypothetical protein
MPKDGFKYQYIANYFLCLINLVGAFWIQGVLYGSVGFGCGLIGQGIANMIMNAKR